jgi:hypothetical protein
MRALVAVVFLVGCGMPKLYVKPYVEPAPPDESEAFVLTPETFRLTESADNVFSRSAQIAANLEMSVAEMNKTAGLLRAQVSQPVNSGRGTTAMRVMTMTVLVGAGTATISSAVALCTRVTPATCTELPKVLNAFEAQKLRDFIARIEALSGAPVQTGTRPAAEL